MHSNCWEDLEAELDDIVGKKPVPTPVKKDKDKAVAQYFVILAISLVGLYFLWNYKANQLATSNAVTYVPTATHIEEITEIEKVEPVKVFSDTDKLKLISILFNQNVAVSRMENPPLDDYIHINGDWTINKIPNQVNLDVESEEFVRSRLRKP